MLYGPAGTRQGRHGARPGRPTPAAVFINRWPSSSPRRGFTTAPPGPRAAPPCCSSRAWTARPRRPPQPSTPLLREMDGLANGRVLTVVSVSRPGPPRSRPCCAAAASCCACPWACPDVEERSLLTCPLSRPGARAGRHLGRRGPGDRRPFRRELDRRSCAAPPPRAATAAISSGLLRFREAVLEPMARDQEAQADVAGRAAASRLPRGRVMLSSPICCRRPSPCARSRSCRTASTP